MSGSAPVALDRIQVVVRDRTQAADAWTRLLDAAVVGEDRLRVLGCRRTTLAVGASEVELLEAEPGGVVEKAGPGLFAAGFASDDPAALRGRLESKGVAVESEGDQMFLAAEALGDGGMRVVVSPARERRRQGLLTHLYEVTNLVADPARWSARLADLFGLDPGGFVPIRSEHYGYEGVLTLFRPGVLDRVEVIHPHDRDKTMGRFHAKRGACLYMGYGESDRADEIRDRARSLAPDDWTGPAGDAPVDNLFLHPRALGGVMLGVSRSTFAWTWSGAPERVQPAG